MSVYMGIDWSKKKTDIVFLNEVGAIIARLTIAHQARGFSELDETRRELSVAAGDCELRSLKFPIYLSLVMRLWRGLLKPRGTSMLGTELAGEIEQ